MKLEVVGDLTLASEYWDCECEQYYIHPKSVKHCPLCGEYQEDMPNSRACEVADAVKAGWLKEV